MAQIPTNVLEASPLGGFATLPDDTLRELERIYVEEGQEALEAALARAAGGARTPVELAGGDLEPEISAELRAGILAGALLGELEQALEAATSEHLATPQDRAAAAATLSHLATAAREVDTLMRAQDTAQIGPAIDPRLVARAVQQLDRLGRMLAGVLNARGRFTTDEQPDEVTTGPWAEVRIVPDGFEDLDPQAILRLAGELADAGGHRR